MEQAQEPVTPTPYKGITKENAREFSKLAVQARLEKRLARELAENIGVLPRIIGSVAPMLSPLVPLVDQSNEFREAMKQRTRAHIQKLQDKIDCLLEMNKFDFKAMKDCTDAVKNLEAIEQKLSGRPGPGTLKPSNRPARKSGSPTPEPEFEG